MRGWGPVWGGARVAVAALAALGVAVYGLIAERSGGGGGVRQRAEATGRGRVLQAGRDVGTR
ncbi:hypothetical protein ACWEQG_30230 [Microbispora sp. NPDC004025]